MKLIYIANIRLPTEKAHGVQIMKMCEAFAELGHGVELVVTDRSTDIRSDPFAYYQVKRNFKIIRLNAPNTVHFGALGFIFSSFVFAHAAAQYVKRSQPDLVYGRDERVLVPLLRLANRVVWETHTGAWNNAARKLSIRAHRIVAISQGLKDFYVERGVQSDKIIVAHDGIDLEQFANPESKEAARKRLGLPLDKKIAMYIGRLDGWKGTDTLLEASQLLSEDFLVVMIGGESKQVEGLSKKYQKVKFLGYRPYSELPNNQAAADVLVLPNTGKDVISQKYTSPLKLFSYMASGRPIVASDLPSIREIVNAQSVTFTAPDDGQSLAIAIETALGEIKAANTLQDQVKTFTWLARAKKIIESI